MLINESSHLELGGEGESPHLNPVTSLSVGGVEWLLSRQSESYKDHNH